MSSAMVAPIKEDNKLRVEDRAAHDWYRFVLSYPAHLVRDYLDRFKIDSTQTVLDPFCGTGTTLVECKKLGIPSVGVESNPMASLASKVKVDWNLNPNALLTHAEMIARHAWEKLESQGISDSSDLPLLPKKRARVIELRTLPYEKARL
ncbi:MAG: hypothetical protein QOF72_188 [Blastocatellia bacterium]|jgi:hypothetical protein|nr:hypothetical protein [Blastocatellia bacterium]